MSPIFLQATTTTTILLISLLLLFTPTTTAADVVLDDKNNPVETGPYYVGISIAFNKSGLYVGGAITMFNNGSESCPSFIVATSKKINNYIPIKFTLHNTTEKDLVYTNSKLNISFEFLFPEPLCRRRYTTVWTERGNSVVLDGEEGSNGSWFKFEKVDYLALNSYFIFYGKREEQVFYDEQPNGEILLSLEKGYPFIVMLNKVEYYLPRNTE